MDGGNWKEMLVAVHNGDLDLVKYHVRAGVDINYQHPELLTTPLIDAAEYGQYEIAEYLLAQGADPKIPAGFSSDTPLRMARRHGHRDIVRLLRQHMGIPWWRFW